MSAKVISFINFKGGVGKTSCVVNIGATLAKYHHKKTLIVDLDPQCNSSLWLMKPEHWRLHIGNGVRSTYQLFQDQIIGTQEFDFDQAVLRGAPWESSYPLIANLDLLPGAVELLRIEDQIHNNKYVQYFRFLFKALKPYFQSYDYILLDCPPNIYSVTKNALFCSTDIVIPFLPDYLSLSGFQILSDKISEFYDRVSGSMTGRARPEIKALIISHYRSGKAFDSAINELEITLQKVKEQGLVSARAKILRPYIRHNVDVAAATNEHLPVILHKPSSIGAQDYSDLTQNFVTHFEGPL